MHCILLVFYLSPSTVRQGRKGLTHPPYQVGSSCDKGKQKEENPASFSFGSMRVVQPKFMVVVKGILLKKHLENKQQICCKNTSSIEAIKSTVEGGGNGDQKCFEIIVCRSD